VTQLNSGHVTPIDFHLLVLAKHLYTTVLEVLEWNDLGPRRRGREWGESGIVGGVDWLRFNHERKR
jgi:hypothetical protein